MKSRLLTMLVATLLVPLAMKAAGYSATFKDARMKDALEILSVTTGYDFVYQSGLLDEVNNTVTGSYTDVSLDRLLNQTLTRQLGLRYVIVDKTISLSRTSTMPQPPGIVSGTIIDEEGLPLAGATIRVKDSTTAVMSDINGDFVIVPDKPDATLLFNYIGMSPLEMELNETNSSRPLSIIMKRDVNLMDEVVVTGYQAIKRENATGAFQIVTSKDIDARTLYSLRENLEGKVAGLVGNSDDMQIRGVSTLNASRSPLIVVDGLPISGSLDEINTYDVEKITVLKDAAAAAVYGARASYVVFVVTTKRG
ncbi:MAG: carboxypeptidase-like regulatory domain-containing protein, partial [Muribaculaceae bacterium]|nr:carboxypeptidase-like regulatory domain-containing protein [Muribaculaceae bacterium]